MEMKNLYQKYVKETFDENGVLTDLEFNVPDNFNFGYDVIDEIGRNEPDRRAIVWINDEGEEHTFTYGDLMKKSNQVANMLIAHGIKKGDMVMSVLKRHYQFWFLVIALCKIGAVIIPATNQLMKKDYTYRFDAAEVDYIVATGDGDTVKHIEQALEEYKGIKEKFIVRGHGNKGWTDFDVEYVKYPDTFERIENNVEDNMLLYFTSGTTGYPKMVMHNHYYSVAHIVTAKYWHHLDSESLHLTISESGWGKCMWGKMYGQFLCAAALFIYDFDRFHSADILKKIQDYKITSFCAPPTMYRMFIKEGIEGYDLSNLKRTSIAGEALNPEVFNRWYEFTGLKVMEGYGQTETVLAIGNLYGMTPKAGSTGKPTPLFDVKIVDDDGNEVDLGVHGEIVLIPKTKQKIGIFKEYYKNPEATAYAWRGGVYHTGDLAYKDEEGYFWYVGRKDDVIKSSGYRIGPFEIESVLMEHPAVLEVAVTGVPDPIRGQVVKATIVLTKAYKDKGDENLVKELQEHVKNQTAPYKYPRVIEFVDELPKTISGKIRRVAIREKDKNANA
ncbi:MAG: AMP-binding protein [Oscillospiraceae bacterium]|nr:AMP-binding protein [Oscillospiraceae bacterium]